MQSNINVAFATDSNYASYTIVAMTSVLLNTDSQVNFYILASELSIYEKKAFMELESLKKCKVFLFNINALEYKKYLPSEDFHYTTPVYYRFLLPELLQDVDKILYLDCDLIVNGNISELFNTNLGKYPMGMCEDINKFSFNKRIGMNVRSVYYNAGVILFNCKIWREKQFKNELFSIAKKQKRDVEFPIQDILNPYMEGKVYTLDKSWNCQVYQDSETSIACNFSCDVLTPKIIHYIGRIKPWSQEAFANEYFEEYNRYKKYISNGYIAPIVLFVYNRLDTLVEVISALKKNTLACLSDLIIYSDGEKKINDPMVMAVRRFIKTIVGFRTVTIIERNKNIGLSASLISGITEVVEKFGKIIVLEDDIKTSPYFLEFMNQALDIYANDDAVSCVSAYNYPISGARETSFFIKGADIWGWATWKRAWKFFESNPNILINALREKKLEKEFTFNDSYNYIDLLYQHAAGKISSWDVCWYASAFLNDMFCLYPSRSLVQNIGFSGGGTHCTVSTQYDVPLNVTRSRLTKIPIVENPLMRKRFEIFFRKTNFASKYSRIKQKLRVFFKDCIPPICTKAVKKFIKKNLTLGIAWQGDYPDWQSAVADCDGGYDSDAIFQSVVAAARKVRDGEALWERDSVCFYHEEYNWPLLASLMHIASLQGGKLHVLDFGGALGSTYRQHKKFLDTLPDFSWNIIEQAHVVECGQKEFASDKLHFYPNIDACFEDKNITCVLLSSVLQYLPDPYAFIDAVLLQQPLAILIDRTPFLPNSEKITIQNVPEEIYKASYVCRWVNKELVQQKMCNLYTYIVEFPSQVDPEGFYGLYYTLKK